jgi:cobyrinic acid a,c-diamide synthase
MHGIVVAGTHSGCGKTTVTLGLMAALGKRGLKVQSFKAGPDYIDSGLHRVITGRPSRNLDLFMCGESYVRDCLRTHARDVDIAVVEGVMGLFDGDLSTASLAKTLRLPVALVIDAYGMAETSGALVRGFREYAAERGLTIGGIIFNRVASLNHYRRLMAGNGGIPVWGFLPRELDFEIPHRHLGLTVAEDGPIAGDQIDRLAKAVEDSIDLDSLIRAGMEEQDQGVGPFVAGASSEPGSCVVAIAHDRAFNFYYEDNLDLLRKAGAEIVRFSPLADEDIPERANAVYIGGGYPEIHAGELSKNAVMCKAIREWAMSGRPLYAECGGLMYLSEGIYDFDGNFFGMTGVFPFRTRMKSGRSRLGYREIDFTEDCVIGRKGEKARGHEFHYSEIVDEGAASLFERVYSVENGDREVLGSEGYRYKNTLASYIHIHFGSNPHIAEVFVNQGKEKGR